MTKPVKKVAKKAVAKKPVKKTVKKAVPAKKTIAKKAVVKKPVAKKLAKATAKPVAKKATKVAASTRKVTKAPLKTKTAIKPSTKATTKPKPKTTTKSPEKAVGRIVRGYYPDSQYRVIGQKDPSKFVSVRKVGEIRFHAHPTFQALGMGKLVEDENWKSRSGLGYETLWMDTSKYRKMLQHMKSNGFQMVDNPDQF